MVDAIVESKKGLEIEHEPCSSDSPKSDIDISYSDIASKLLRDGFLLTALELHCELTESGKELPKLKEFFSNPVNFEQNSRVETSNTGLSKCKSFIRMRHFSCTNSLSIY